MSVHRRYNPKVYIDGREISGVVEIQVVRDFDGRCETTIQLYGDSPQIGPDGAMHFYSDDFRSRRGPFALPHLMIQQQPRQPAPDRAISLPNETP